MDSRVCDWCGSNVTFISRGYPEWRNIDGKPWCLRCYRRIFQSKTGKKRQSIDIPMEERVCQKCGSNKTNPVVKNGKSYQNWKNVNGECWCDRCYQLYIHYPKTIRLNYKGKLVYLKERIKTGKCQLCQKNVGDNYIDYDGNEKTLPLSHLHHMEYHDDDVLKDTIELCISCHTKVTWVERKGKKFIFYTTDS